MVKSIESIVPFCRIYENESFEVYLRKEREEKKEYFYDLGFSKS